MGFWRKVGQVIVNKAQEELNEGDPQQQAQQAPPHSAPSGAPSFPSPQTHGISSYDHLSSQFNNLNVGAPGSGTSTPGYAYNNSSYGNTASSPPPASLTPGNNAGLQYGGQPSQNVDYMSSPPLKNPLPRPPQLSNIPIPEPWDPYQRYYGGNTPQGGDNLMPPMGGPPAPGFSGYPYPGPQSAASSPGPGPTMPSPAGSTPAFGRASSQPPPSTSSAPAGDGTTQCAGVTKKGTRCTRKVKSPPALGWINPEDEIPRYCHQHSKELLNVTGFYGTKGWVEFDDWVPKYLDPDTQTILRAEMEKPISTADVPGYIYCYELRDPDHGEVVHLKVGRAVNLVKRIDEWTKTCESKEPILRGWYPGPDDEEAGRVSMMKGVVMAGRKGANCHRLERLIHLELADLVINKPYLNDDFLKGQVKGTGAAPSQKKAATSTKNDATSTPKRKTRAAGGATSSAKKKKAKAAADDDDEDDDEDEDFDDDSSGSNGSNNSTGSGGKKRKGKGPKMAVRQPCKDCGQVHKEIFTFIRPTGGALKNKEWERIVQPVMDRWGTYIDYHT